MARPFFSTTLTLFVLGFSLSSLAFTPASTEVDGRSIPVIEWDTTLKKFQFDKDKFIGQRFSAKCPAVPSSTPTDVSQTATYASSHSICDAALRAGQITKDGGIATVQLNSGGGGHSSARTLTVVRDIGAEAANSAFLASLSQLDWDTKFTKTGFAYKQLIGQRFTFKCPSAPASMRARRIIGTDLYAFNSMICRAAVHAGAITTSGGMVTVQMNPGKVKLTGSIRNGVETRKGISGMSALSFVENPVNQ